MRTKYKNLRFCSPSNNEDCRNLLNNYIFKIKNHYQGAEIPSPFRFSEIQRQSISVERMVRNLFGSQKDRYLMYDVIYDGTYHTRMREIDFVNIKSEDTIQIGEIKFTSNKKQSIHRGLQQLQISTDILKNKYSNVECVLIIVNISNQEKIDETFDSLFSNSKKIRKESGFEYELIEISADLLLNNISKITNISFDIEGLQSAINEALTNYEKRMQNKIDKIVEMIQKMILDKTYERIELKPISVRI